MGGVSPSIAAFLARDNRPGDDGAVYGLGTSVRAGGRALVSLLGLAVALSLGLRAAFVVAGGVIAVAAGLGLWRLAARAEGERAIP